MDLSIIIVNWNSRNYLEECLDSLRNCVADIEYEVIVVDNASYDGSKEMMNKCFPVYRYLQSKTNGGFAYANNIGAREANGKVLLFLNPDTEIIGDAIQKVYEIVTHDKKIGLASGVLLNSDGSIQSSCVQTYPTVLNQLLDSEKLRTFFPKSAFWGNAVLFEDNTGPHQVEALSGAFLMIRGEAFEDVNGFDERYFMYAEDIDLCFRTKMAGYKVVLVNNSKIIHHGGGSASDGQGTRFANVMMRDSIYKFLINHKGRAYANAYRVGMIGNALLRLFVLTLGFPFQWFKTRHLPTGSLAKWSHILSWGMGVEKWRRN